MQTQEDKEALEYFIKFMVDARTKILMVRDKCSKELDTMSNVSTKVNQNGNEMVMCDLYPLLNSNNEKYVSSMLKNLLIICFGEDGYNNKYLLKVTKDAMKKMNKENPKSFDDDVLFIKEMNDVVNNKTADSNFKKSCSDAIFYVQQLIANMVVYKMKMLDEVNASLDGLNEIINGYAQKRPININEKESFYKIINENIKINTKSNDEKLSEYVEQFLSTYEETVLLSKEEKHYQNKLHKYEKAITKTSFDKLTNHKFPRYDDADFKRYMNDLINIVEDSNEEYKTELLGALGVHYAGYYKKLKKAN